MLSQESNNELRRCRFLSSFNIGRYEFEGNLEEDEDKAEEILQVARRQSEKSGEGENYEIEPTVDDILTTIEQRNKSLERQESRRHTRTGRIRVSTASQPFKEKEPDTKRRTVSGIATTKSSRRQNKDRSRQQPNANRKEDAFEALALGRLKRESFERRTRRLVTFGWHLEQNTNRICSPEDIRLTSQSPGKDALLKAMEGRRALAEKRKTREHYDNRLRRISRAISYVLRLGNHMKSHSESLLVETTAMEAWRQIRSNKETSFSKSNFATEKKSYLYVPTWAKAIFSKAPESRTDFDVAKAHELMQELDAFENFSRRMQMAICRVLQYVSLESGRVVLRKGHVGYNFYFVFSGSLFVNIESAHKGTGGQAWKTTAVLQRGDCFGEVALLKSVHRTATVAVRERAELLTVDRETFVNICPELLNQELNEKVHFCQTLPYFEPWTKELLREICFDSRIRSYESNKVIIADSGIEKDWIYICMEGKCMVLRGVTLCRDRNSSSGEQSFRGSLRKISSSQHSSAACKISQVRTELQRILLEKQKADSDTEGSSSDEEHDGNKGPKVDPRLRLMRSGEKAVEKIRGSDRKPRDEHGEAMGVTKKRNVPQKPQVGKTKTHPSTAEDEGAREAKPLRARSLSICTVMTAMSKAERNISFLHFRTITRGGVFDPEGMLNHFSRGFMLVSLGARVLKIKMAKFLKYANKQYLQHWEETASSERYPLDKELTRAFDAQAQWENYKATTVRTILAENKGIDRMHHTEAVRRLSPISNARRKSRQPPQKKGGQETSSPTKKRDMSFQKGIIAERPSLSIITQAKGDMDMEIRGPSAKSVSFMESES